MCLEGWLSADRSQRGEMVRVRVFTCAREISIYVGFILIVSLSLFKLAEFL